MKKYIYLKILIIELVFTSCISNFNALENNSVLIAEREGVANCMTYLYFLKNGEIVQKSVCFGITTKEGIYEFKGDSINIYWDISEDGDLQKNDTTNHDFAIIKRFEDRIGHTYKKLYYCNSENKSPNYMVFNAYDDETKCLGYNTMVDSSDLTFLSKRLSQEEVFDYEKTFQPKIKKGNFRLSEEYYPNELGLELDTPIVFDRSYVTGIPLETSYLYHNQDLMVQYHEWSDFGVTCKKNFNRKAYKEIYSQLIEKISKVKGKPIKIIGKLDDKETTQFKRIWDNENERLELHLYLYNNFRIRLINYWK